MSTNILTSTHLSALFEQVNQIADSYLQHLNQTPTSIEKVLELYFTLPEEGQGASRLS